MRTHLLLATLLLISTGLVGCLGDDTATEADNANTNQTNPAPSYTQLNIHDTHDFTQGAATTTFDVPENATANRIHIYFDHWSPEDSADAGTCANQDPLTIHVQDPAGNTYKEITRDAGGIYAGSGSGSNCGGTGQTYDDRGILIAPGQWTIHYNGTGFAIGHVVFDSP